METASTRATQEQPHPRPESAPLPLTTSKASLFLAFGTGHSYVFYVDGKSKRAGSESGQLCEGECKKDGRGLIGEENEVKKKWAQGFEESSGWSCQQFEKHGKPLGWMARLTLNAKNCPEISEPIQHLQRFFRNCGAAWEGDAEAYFFTAGVGVLVLHLSLPEGSAKTQESIKALRDPDKIKEIKESRVKIVRACTERYTVCMTEKIESAKPGQLKKWFGTPEVILKRFKEADQNHQKFPEGSLYPLFFIDEATYCVRTKEILGKVAGSKRIRASQSDQARVSYTRSEIYVDWTEALVRGHTDANCTDIENNFIVATASWYALVLMDDLASIYLLEAFAGLVSGRYYSTADEASARGLAYMDVANAAHPIRWTIRRKDLFLLEAIHRNWSSERWWKNIEERMKLLSLHYDRLEGERKERDSKRLTFAAVFLTCVTLMSAVADLVALAVNDVKSVSARDALGHLKEPDVAFAVLIPTVVGAILFLWFWVSRLLSRARRLPSESLKAGGQV